MGFLLCLQEGERATKGIQEEEGNRKARQIAGTRRTENPVCSTCSISSVYVMLHFAGDWRV